MGKKPTKIHTIPRRRTPVSLGLDIPDPQSLIGITPVSDASTCQITVERKGGVETYTGMAVQWKSDRRIVFVDLKTNRETTISADFIKVVQAAELGK